MLYQLSGLFIVVLLLLVFARQVAFAIGLVDKPSERKRHQGHIPLVGGIVLYLAILLMLLWQPSWMPQGTVYLLCVTVLALMGALDDRFDLPVAPRVLAQGGIALVMILEADMELESFGYLLGNTELLLGGLTLLITPLAVWGAINAYNMVDGIDGQLGVLSCVTFSALALLFGISGQLNLALWCLGLMVTLAAFLLFNLGVFGQQNKIFMGDTGSMVIGFTVLWLLIAATQGEQAVMRPVTALWLIAIPLMDMVTVMVRRLMRHQSPFKAGRDHIHHILMRRGLNARQALGMSCMLSITLACVGICSEVLLLPEDLMLLAFVFCFIGYFSLLREPRATTVFPERRSADR